MLLEYSAWLAPRYVDQRMGLAKLRGDFPFFERLDEAFRSRAEVGTESLIMRLTPRHLQSYRRVVWFLADRKLMDPLESDGTRILLEAYKVLANSKASDPPWIQDCLATYWRWLSDLADTYRKRGHVRTLFPLQFRSVGIALRSARRLLLVVASRGGQSPTAVQQSHVDAICASDSSSAGNLSKFIAFLNKRTRRFDVLKAPGGSVLSKLGPTLSQTQFSSFVRDLQRSQDKIDLHWRFCTLLCLLYMQRPHRALALRMERIRIIGPVVEVQFHREWVALHRDIGGMGKRWLQRRIELQAQGALADAPFLFPSRSPHRPESPESLSDWLRERRVQLRQLFPSSLANAARSNVSNIHGAMALLGVTNASALRYMDAFGVLQRKKIEFATRRSNGMQREQSLDR